MPNNCQNEWFTVLNFKLTESAHFGKQLIKLAVLKQNCAVSSKLLWSWQIPMVKLKNDLIYILVHAASSRMSVWIKFQFLKRVLCQNGYIFYAGPTPCSVFRNLYPEIRKKISYIFPVQAIAAQTDMTMRANNKNGTDHPDFSYTQVWWKRSCLMSYNPWQCISNETRKSSHFPLRLEANYKATSGCLNLLLSRKHPSSARENG